MRGIGALQGLREHADAEQRAREQHARPERAGFAPHAPDRERHERDREDGEQHEPGEDLLRGREPGERPRPVERGDDARDADEMARAGRERQPARGPQMEDRVDDHPPHTVPGPAVASCTTIGREPDRGSDQRSFHDRPGEAPEGRATAERDREAEIDPEQHGEAAQHTAEQRPARGATPAFVEPVVCAVVAGSVMPGLEQRDQARRARARPHPSTASR